MTYYIGQAFGLLSTACCLILPLLKKKRQMLVAIGLNNLLVIMNVLFLAGFSSAVMVCAVAVVQAIVALRHLEKGTEVARRENVLFFLMYVGAGLFGFHSAVDALPIFGAVFNMLATFQKDEQRTRWLLLINASTFAVYYVLIGSTALLSVLCAIVSNILGLYRYRKRETASNTR